MRAGNVQGRHGLNYGWLAGKCSRDVGFFTDLSAQFSQHMSNEQRVSDFGAHTMLSRLCISCKATSVDFYTTAATLRTLP